MKPLALLALLALLAAPVAASVVVIFDAASTPVAGAVVRVLPSANTPDYSARPDVLINPDLSAVAAFERRHWKVAGGLVLAMDAAERQAVDDAAQAAQDEAEMGEAERELDRRILVATVRVLVRQLNEIRAWNMAFKTDVAAANSLGSLKARVAASEDLPPLTPAQIRAAIRARIRP